MAAPGTVSAATFQVAAGDVTGPIQAIELANLSPNEADTINLAGGTYTLLAPYEGETGLPLVTSPLTIEGNGAIIERSGAPGIPGFRIFFVGNAHVEFNDLTIRNGQTSVAGGGLVNISGTVVLTSTIVTGNGSGQGGGIYNMGTLASVRSTLSGNSATGTGGGVYNEGTLTVTLSTITGNRSEDDGGGIYNTGAVDVMQSNIAGNFAFDSGGGILINVGELTITESTLSGNQAIEGGGGIAVLGDATVTLTNSTLSGNSAFEGGGIRATFGTTTLIHSTMSGNSAAADGGAIATVFQATLSLTNSIVASSPSGGNCFVEGSTSFLAEGNNLATDGTCPGVNQVTSGQLNLGPLFNNGGPTRTHALLAGSVAIDAGDMAKCADHDIVTDQRGFLRDSHCDIGAFEFGAGLRADLLISQSVDKIGVKQGDVLTYFITVQNLGPDTAPNVVVTDTMSSGTTFVSVKVNKGTVTAPPVGNTGTVTWYLGDMLNADSETAQLAVTVLVKGRTTITNTADVTADVVDPNAANNSAAITVSVAPGSGGGGGKNK